MKLKLDKSPEKLLSNSEIETLLNSGHMLKVRRASMARLASDPRDAEAHYFLGVLQLSRRNGKKALPELSAALELSPEESRYLVAHAIAMDLLGKGREALDSIQKALSVAPDDIVVLLNFCRLAIANGTFEQAVAPLEQIIAREPDMLEPYHWLGMALQALGDVQRAAEQFTLALRLQPDNPWLRNGLAVCLMRTGQFQDGMTLVSQIVETLPRDREVILNLGIDCRDQGSPLAALQYLQKLYAWFPHDYEGCVELGITLQGLGSLGEALFYFQRAIAVNPKRAEAYSLSGALYLNTREKGKALQAFEQALKLDPKNFDALLYLASLKKEAGEAKLARNMLKKAIRINPRHPQPYLNLIGFLKDSEDFEEAEKVLEEAEKHISVTAETRHARADLRLKRGDIAGAMEIFREILANQPRNPDAMSGLLFCMNYDPETSPETLADAYKDWDRRFAAHLRPKDVKFTNDPDPQRRLKIGYISGDFKSHSVAFFAEPILARHDHENFEIYCYSNHQVVDAVTQRFMDYADRWRWIHNLSDDAVAELIRLDGIDILIDLSNHTAFHRLYTMARKPAPVEMTWIGMPTTTGLSAIDYRVTDARMDPEGMTEALHSEKLLRIGSGWCYVPPDDGKEVPVGELPALKNGFLTYASFNAFGKINIEVIKLWARIFKQQPKARLYMATGGKDDDNALNDTVRRVFKACGFPVKRLFLFGRKSFKDYFNFHNEVDLVLDSFPYNGGTVTAHALWMAVPVITLAGKKSIQRMGVSMLTSVGIPEFIAETPDEYVDIANRYKNKFEQLAEIRRNLRPAMQQSPLMDAQAVTSDLEEAFRKVWREWCASADA